MICELNVSLVKPLFNSELVDIFKTGLFMLEMRSASITRIIITFVFFGYFCFCLDSLIVGLCRKWSLSGWSQAQRASVSMLLWPPLLSRLCCHIAPIHIRCVRSALANVQTNPLLRFFLLMNYPPILISNQIVLKCFRNLFRKVFRVVFNHKSFLLLKWNEQKVRSCVPLLTFYITS